MLSFKSKLPNNEFSKPAKENHIMSMDTADVSIDIKHGQNDKYQIQESS